MNQPISLINDIVDVIIRPVRVLWCIPIDDIDQGLSAIKYNSRFWGGMHNAIVPFNQGKILKTWFNFALKYDPDILVILTDEKYDKTQFQEFLSYFIYKKPFLAEIRNKNRTSTYNMGMNISKISNVLSEYKFNFTTSSALKGYRIVKLAILGNPPSEYEDIASEREDEWETIQFCTLFSGISDLYDEEDVYEYLSELFNQTPSELEDIGEQEKQRTHFSIASINNYTSNQISLESGYPQSFLFLLISNCIILVGNTQKVENLALFWNLRIYKKEIIWIAPEHLEKTLSSINKKYKQIKISVVSHELHETDLARKIDELKPNLRNISIEAAILKDLSLLPKKAITPKNYPMKPIPITFTNNMALFSADIVDSFIADINARKGRINFIVELNFKNFKVPKRDFLSKLYSSSKGMRISNMNGFCFFLTNEYYYSTIPFPSTTYHFEIHKPPMLTLLKELCKEKLNKNFVKIEISDKGKYTQNVLALFGSIAECASSLEKGYFKCIIDSFLYKNNQKLQINKLEWTFDGLKNEVNRRKNMKNQELSDYYISLQELINKRIVLQGLSLKCKECGWEGWYPLNQISEKFQCSRCLSIGSIPLRPKWCYRLNNVVFEAHNQNFQSTIKALAELSKLKKTDLSYLPEFEIYYKENEEENKVELDFFTIIDGKIGLGEAKKSIGGFKEKEYKKILKINDWLDPDAFYIVFQNLHNQDPLSNKWIEKLKEEMANLVIIQ